jgi:hypothetical protein
MSERYRTEASHGEVPDISRRSQPLPSWLAGRVLQAGEEITWVWGPRFNPPWERYITHPALFLVALALGLAGFGAGQMIAGAEPASPRPTEVLALLALAGGVLVLGSIFVLGIANGYFTRLVVTNSRLVILQGYEVCRSWSIERLPRSLTRYVRPVDGPESRAIDLDALTIMLGGSSDKFTAPSTILTFGKRLDQITNRDKGRP